MKPPSTPKGGCRHETTAPIDQKTEPATAGVSREAAQTITANGGAGSGPRPRSPLMSRLPFINQNDAGSVSDCDGTGDRAGSRKRKNYAVSGFGGFVRRGAHSRRLLRGS